MTTTNTGNARFAGNAARNCASGWIRSASFGRSPIQTPTGTHISVASAISTTTRASVMNPYPIALKTSDRLKRRREIFIIFQAA